MYLSSFFLDTKHLLTQVQVMKLPSGTTDDLWGVALCLDAGTGSSDKTCEAHV